MEKQPPARIAALAVREDEIGNVGIDPDKTRPMYCVRYAKRNGVFAVQYFRGRAYAQLFAGARKTITPNKSVRFSRIRILSVETEEWPCATL